MAEISYFYVALAGLLSFLSPCVLPIVPGYLCFLAGTSLDKIASGEDASKERNVFYFALSFVFGFSTVFILLGASATLLSGIIYEYLDILRVVGGIIIIIFGIHFMQIIQLPFLNRDTRYQIESYRPGIVGSYVIGLSFAFGWTPCIGPILGSVLSIAASSETVTYGIVLLMLYSAGLGIPFLLAAYAINGFMRFLSKIRNYIRAIEIFTGVLLVIFGILILTNRIQELAFFFIKYFPFLTQFG
ncbi:cytochrome c biogenesis CcdA family protein [Pelagibacteraceae bacterium]|nr:cytochrome c biogenesis CcdA family protein [Pelagibacteraceae bacterium]